MDGNVRAGTIVGDVHEIESSRNEVRTFAGHRTVAGSVPVDPGAFARTADGTTPSFETQDGGVCPEVKMGP